ncbi:PD-(D/E)XK motif protein [Paenibacillus sp. V4I5]|uniref:PD-(D/E)XK motif protein n=1 Tax=Paenibacillus sp. V4I5 TaxID=3042306 RepID=UPI00278E1477|nr:PD-(D/E)XK motif protein [Paenibacillus sp. V4I5]MDQ0919163.1 hypothetical protein [Paenibacillus sp. V4I5]
MSSESVLIRLNGLSNVELDAKYKLFTYTDDVYYGVDDAGCYVFVVCSDNPGLVPTFQKTKELIFRYNIRSLMNVDGEKSEKVVHVLTCLSQNTIERTAFIRLTEAFIPSLSGQGNTKEIYQLFASLSNLFSSEKEVSFKELQGLYCELYAIKLFAVSGLTIHKAWQSKEKMRFDFSFSNSKRMEIKSTQNENRIHHFKHEQLLSDLYEITIMSCLLKRDDRGLSLYELINSVRDLIDLNYVSLLIIEKIIKNIPLDYLKQIKFDEDHLKRNVKFYSAKDVPRFLEPQPEGVSNTEYNSDLSNVTPIEIEDVIKWIVEL